jgi:hypothetical protein
MPGEKYQYVAASATNTVLGTSLAGTDDYIMGVLIIPESTAAGAVSIKDGSDSSMTIFGGGGVTSLGSLIPFPVPLGLKSRTGAWTITTGTNVHVIVCGQFK